MSSTDTRVVEMRFDNSQFENGIKSSMSYLEKLKSSLDLSSSEKSLESLEKAGKKFSLAGIGESVDQLNKKFSTMGIIGMTAVSNITNNAINTVRSLTSSVVGLVKTGGINRALNIESAKFQLEGLGVAWDTIKDDINYGVKDTAYGLDAAAKVASQLVASGVQLGDTMKTDLRAISGVAAMTNSSYEEIGQIFTTIAGNGKLMTEQLRQFSSRGLNVAATLGEALGKSESEIRDMVTKGQIDFATFAKAMDDAFGAHAKDANKTFTGALSNMKAALSRIGADIATPAMENLRKVFNALTPVIDTIHTALGPAITDLSERMRIAANMATIFLNALDIEKISTDVSALIESLKPSAEVIDKLERSFNGVIAVLDIFAEIAATILPPVLDALGFSVTTVGGTILDITAKIGDMLSAFRDWVLENKVIQNTVGIAAEALGLVVEAIEAVITAVKNSDVVQDVLIGIEDVFERLFSYIGSKTPVVTNQLGKFANALANVKNSITENGIIGTLSSLRKQLISFRKEVSKGDSVSLPKLSKIKIELPGVTALLEAFGAALKKFSWATTIVNGIIIALSFSMVKLYSSISRLVGNLADLISPVRAINVAMNALKPAINAFANRQNTQAVKNIATSVLEIVGAIAILSLLDMDRVTTALIIVGGIAATLVGLSAAFAAINKEIGSVDVASKSFLIFAASLIVMVKAIEELSKAIEESKGYTVAAIVELAALAAILAGFAFIMSKFKVQLSKSLTVLLPVAAAVWLLVDALKKLAQENVASIVASTGAAIVEIVGIIAALTLVTKNVTGIGGAASILIIAFAIEKFASVIAKLSEISPYTVLKSLPALLEVVTTLGIILVALAAAGKDATKAGIAAASIAGAVYILSAAFKALGKISGADLIKGLGVMSVLTLLFSAIISATDYAGPNAAKAAVTLLAFAAAIDILVVAVGVLSMLDPIKLAAATTAITVLGLMMTGLIAVTKKSDVAARSAARIGTVMVALAAAIGLLALLDSASVLKSAVAISMVVTTLGGILAVISKMKKPAKGSYTTIAVITLVIAGLSTIFVMVSKFANADDVLKIAGSMSQILIAIADAIAVVGVVGKAADGAWKVIAQVALVLGAIGLVITGVGALINKYDKNGVTKAAIQTAADILELIGQAIGGAIGGIIDGFLVSATKDLETVASNLTTFAESITDFLDSISEIDNSKVSAVDTMVDVVGKLAAAEIGNDISTIFSWVVGNKDRGTTLKGTFSDLGEALAAFSEKTKDVKTENIQTAAKATEALVDLMGVLPRDGGIWTDIFGSVSFEQLGQPLEDYGDALKKFNDAVSGEDFDTKAIKSAAKATEALVDVVNALPETGGKLQDFFGEYNLTRFGTQLEGYAESIVAFAGALRESGFTKKDVSNMQRAAEASSPLVDLCNALDPSGGTIQNWIGESNISTFGYRVKTYIDYLVKMSDALESNPPDYDAIENARKCTEDLIDLCSQLDPTGGIISKWITGEKDFSTFGKNLEDYGESLAGFSEKIVNVNATKIESLVTTSKTLVGMLSFVNNNSERMSSGLGSFVSWLSRFGVGLADYANRIRDVNSGKVTSSVTAAKAIANFGSSISGFNSTDYTNFGKAVEALGKNVAAFYIRIKNIDTTKITSLSNSFHSISELAKVLKSISNVSFENVITTFRDVASISVENMERQFNNAGPRIQKSIKSIMDKSITTLESYRSKMEKTAGYIVLGFVNGINKNSSGIQNAGTSLGSKFLTSFNNSLKVESPSKETKETGEYVVEGFVNGVSDGYNDITDSGLVMGESLSNGLKGATKGIFSTISDAISGGTKTVKDKTEGYASQVVSGVTDWYTQAKKQIEDEVSSAATSTVTTATSATTSAISSSTKTTTKATTSSVKKSSSSTKKVAKVEYTKVGKIIVSALNAGIANSTDKLKYSTEQINVIGANVIKQVQTSLKSADSVFADYYEATDEKSKRTKATLAEAANAFIAFRDAVKESMKSAVDGFEAFENETEVTAKDIIANLKTQIQAISSFANYIKIMTAKGYDQSLIEYVVNMGAKDGYAYAKAFAYASNKQIKSINKQWEKKSSTETKTSNQITATFVNTSKASKAAEKTVAKTTKKTSSTTSKATKKTTKTVTTGTKTVKKAMQDTSDAVIEANDAAAESVMATATDMVAYLADKYGTSIGVTEELAKASTEFLTKLVNNEALATTTLAAEAAKEEKAVQAVYDSMSYGVSAAKMYADRLTSAENTTYSLERAANAGKTAVQNFAKAIYQSSDEGKEEIETLQKSQKELDELKKSRDKAKKALTKAKKSGKKDITELQQTYDDACEDVKAKNKEVDESTKTLEENIASYYNDYRNNLISSFSSQFDIWSVSRDSGIDIFSGFNGAVEATEEEAGKTAAEALLEAFNTNVNDWRAWRINLDKLDIEGLLDKDFLAYLKGLGLSGAEYVAAIAEMDYSQIMQLNSLWATKQADDNEQWFANMEDNLAKIQKRITNIQKLGDLGLDQTSLEALLGKDLDDDTIDRIVGMSDEDLEKLRNMIAEYQKLPEQAADTVITAEATSMEKTDEVVDDVTEKVDTAVKAAYNSGVELVDNLANGIADNKKTATDAADELGTDTVDSAEYTLNTKTGNKLGANLAQGIADGIYSRLYVVRQAAIALAAAASATTASSLGIASPSKVFAEFGRYVDMGFANGVTNALGLVTKSVDKMSGSAVSSVSDAVFRMRDAMDAELNVSTFTLTPVIDLSNAYTQASGINAQLSSRISANVSAAMERSQTDRQLNQQLSRDIANLSNAVAGVQASLNDGSISNMNQLMQTYFPEFTKDIYLDGTKVSSRVETNIVSGIKRRERAWS